MLSATRQKTSRSAVLLRSLSVTRSGSYSTPSFPATSSSFSHDDARAPSTFRNKKNRKLESLAYQATKKTIDHIARGQRPGSKKKLSRGLKELEETRKSVLGAVSARPAYQSEDTVAFSITEARPEDIEAASEEEGSLDFIPDLRVEPGSFVELRRNGFARWGVVLGYEYTIEGTEIVKTLLSTGEALTHPARDMQFSVAGFVSRELAERAGMGTYADESNPVEAQARISMGKSLRSLSGRIEQATRIVQAATDKLYEHARHPDGKTWSKITLAEGVALVSGDSNLNLEITYAVHRHFMDDAIHYIADTFEHRLSNTFTVRPLEAVERMARVINWVRNSDPIIDEFAAKARTIIEASHAQKRESEHETPALVQSRSDLPKLNKADMDILDFARYFLRQRRELQENPCLLILPLILNKISPSYLPLVGHSAFRALEDLSVFAPWSNHVMQDVDLQLYEFTDTLDTPLPGSSSSPPVPPVAVNDDRISRTKIVDGLDNMRHDFGDLAVYVIDDSTAEELDDGISIEQTADGSGNLWLHVHIADPTSVFNPNDPPMLDAARRSATAYFPDVTYPMLPHTDLSLDALVGSSGDASMNVLSFSVLVNSSGDVLKHLIRPAVVRRVHVMRYDDVTRAIGKTPIQALWPFEGQKAPSVTPRPVPAETLPDLKLLQQLTGVMAKARVAKTDSVLWSQPRAQITMDKIKLLTAHDPRPMPRMYRGFPQIDYSVQLGTMANVEDSLDASRALVAECMITAGRVASLFAQEHGIPMIYRSLARPAGVGADKYQPLLPGRDPYQGTVLYRDALVQQLAQVSAQPTLTPAAHWQLGISADDGYVRATSPLRRYLDMLCHWQIKSALHPKSMGVKPPFSTGELKTMMLRQHLQEQARRRAGTTSIRLWAMRYIQNLITNGGHDTLRNLEGIVINLPLNMAHSLEQVIPVMIPQLGLPAAVYGSNVEDAPPIGSSIKVEIASIELGYNPRLVVRQRRA